MFDFISLVLSLKLYVYPRKIFTQITLKKPSCFDVICGKGTFLIICLPPTSAKARK